MAAAGVPLGVAAPAARGTTLHFDYTDFGSVPTSYFQAAQFNVLNYPSIDGNFMYMAGEGQRTGIANANNTLAAYYNDFGVGSGKDYPAYSDPLVEAARIDSYVNTTYSHVHPTWITLNELSKTTWRNQNTSLDGPTYRQWVIGVVTALNETYHYNVVTFLSNNQFLVPDDSAVISDWQALANKSYLAPEIYDSGEAVINGGSNYAQREQTAESFYRSRYSSFTTLGGISASRVMLTEHFGHSTAGTFYGRAGLSLDDWDQAIQIRQDAIRAVGPAGFLAYGWRSDAMQAPVNDMIEAEYYYRSRLVLPNQKPQWLSDIPIVLRGVTQTLSWNFALNWVGGVPNAPGAVANFCQTNTAARTITLDGNHTIGTLTFNSPNSYTIAPGTNGMLILNNSGSLGNVTVSQGTHTITAPLQLQDSANVAIDSGVLTLAGVISGSGGLTKSGAGTLSLATANTYSGATIMNGGVLGIVSSSLGASPSSPTLNVTISNGATLRFDITGLTLSANQQMLLGSGGGVIDTQGFNDAIAGTISGAGLTKAGAGTLTLTNVNTYSGATNVSAGTLVVTQSLKSSASISVAGGAKLSIPAGSAAVIKTTTVSATGSGKIDLADNRLIVTGMTVGSWNGSNYDGVTGLIKSGRSASGDWSGSGIVTSMTAAALGSQITTLAIATAGDLGKTSFGGQSVLPTDVLVMYTYTGDANLSGKIDADDYFQIDSHYSKSTNSAKSWLNGDFNYDGQINGDDYFLIDNAYAGQGVPFATAAGVAVLTPVPEPAGVAIILSAALIGHRRRRRL